jgi:hypothetical protein
MTVEILYNLVKLYFVFRKFLCKFFVLFRADVMVSASAISHLQAITRTKYGMGERNQGLGGRVSLFRFKKKMRNEAKKMRKKL